MTRSAHPIIDCDVHHHYTQATLARFLPTREPVHAFPGGGAFPHPDGAFRADAYPPDSGPPCSDPAFVVTEHLERHQINHAMLTCGSVLGLSLMHDVDRAAEIARAVNDWTVAEWFPADERFLGSILISSSDPVQAAAEIRRQGTNPRMVSAYTTGWPHLMGDAFFDPIYEACVDVGVPLAFHQGGLPLTPHNTPTSFPEMHIGMCIPGLPHVISTVTRGLFVKFPDLRLLIMEFGVAWIPFVMWRLDMEYRAGRDELPWLTRLPSEYIAEHIRFTTQPLEEPKNPRDLVTLLSLFDAKHMLLFSSDYPHWDADNPDTVLRAFPEDWRQRIYCDNAKELFRLEERLGRTIEPAALA